VVSASSDAAGFSKSWYVTHKEAKMIVGLNVGCSHTKAYTQVGGAERCIIFPSALGAPSKARFSLSGSGDNGGAGDARLLQAEDSAHLLEPANVLIGAAAVNRSVYAPHREDDAWYTSDDWLHLALASIAKLTPASTSLSLTTGFPLSSSRRVEDAVKAKLVGEHRVRLAGRHGQTIKVDDAWVIPEPYGTLLDQLWDDNGNTVTPVIAEGKVAVVDIGSRTTNFLSAFRIEENFEETRTIENGAWDVVRMVERWMEDELPGLSLKDYQMVEAMIRRSVRYHGEPVDLSEVVAAAVKELARQIASIASQLWGEAADIDLIILTGGGALLLGAYLRETWQFARATIPDNPVVANARGFYKYGVFRASS
jgi:plasmid segregation protein ParM